MQTHFFLHIPKVAGTTLIQILRQSYRKENHYFYDTRKPDACIEQLVHLSERKKNRIKVVSGHFSFGFHEYFGNDNFKYFTIMRNPVERVISHYNYAKYKRDHYLNETLKANPISLPEYVQSGICNEVNNGMAKQLAGLYVNDNFGYFKKNKEVFNDEDLFRMAQNNIKKHFTFVGIMEEFDKTLILLKESLKISDLNIKYTSRNQAKTKHKKISNEELEIIKEFNKVDIKLYEEYKDIFHQKMEHITETDNSIFYPNILEYYYLKCKRVIHHFV